MRTLNIYELPAEKRQKALEIAARISNSPNLYTSFNGKRLNCDRNIISVPLNGGSFRLLFRDQGKTMDFCGAATHAQYDHLIGSKNCESIRPMEILAGQPKPAPVAAQAELPMPVPVPAPIPQGTGKKNGATKRALAFIKTREAGATLTMLDVLAAAGGSEPVIDKVVRRAVDAGWIVPTGGCVNRRRVYTRIVVRQERPLAQTPVVQPEAPPPVVPAPVAVVPVRGPVQIAAEIANLVQEMVAHLKPCTLEGFSDDDLTLEIHRRMSARKAA